MPTNVPKKSAVHRPKNLRLLSLSKIGRVQDNNLRVQQLKLRLKTSTQSLLIAGLTLVYIFHLLGCMCAAPRPPTVPFSPPLSRPSSLTISYCMIVRLEADGILAAAADALGASPTAAAAIDVLEESPIMTSEWMPPPAYLRVTPAVRLEMTGDLYFYAYWWSLAAMSGEVQIPQTIPESVFNFFVGILGIVVSAFVIGTFTTALSELSAASNRERMKRDQIDQYLRCTPAPCLLSPGRTSDSPFSSSSAGTRRSRRRCGSRSSSSTSSPASTRARTCSPSSPSPSGCSSTSC